MKQLETSMQVHDRHVLLSESPSIVYGAQGTRCAVSPWKRYLDVGLVMVGAVAIVPLVGLIALLIKLTSAGPAFYCHRRIGKGGRVFTMWKFRTMVNNADQVLEQFLARDESLRREWESQHKLRDDPRVTVLGRMLRKTSLDELPQLWNVLLGEMSLVGPRPIVREEVDKYAAAYEDYIEVRPGLTGLWQVSGRNEATYDQRVWLDAYYVRNWSLWLDLYILGRTIKVVVRCEGAY